MAIVLNDNIRVGAGKASEAKYLNLANAPYTGTSQVFSQIPIGERHPGLTVLLAGSPKNIEYWFNTGLTNSALEIKASSGGTSNVTANNGLNRIGNNIRLGGALTGDTIINMNNAQLSFEYTDASTITGYFRKYNDNGFGLGVSSPTDGGTFTFFGSGRTSMSAYSSDFTSHTGLLSVYNNNIELSVDDEIVQHQAKININSGSQVELRLINNSGGTDMMFTMNNISGTTVFRNTESSKGIEYAADYSANYNDRTLVDKGWVLSQLTGGTGSTNIFAGNGLTKNGNIIDLGGSITADTTFSGAHNVLWTSLTNFRLQADVSGGRNARFGLDDGGGYSFIRNDDAGFTKSAQFRVGIDYLYLYANSGGTSVSQIDINGKNIIVQNAFAGFKGVQYGGDYSANFGPRSLVDKGWVLSQISGITGNTGSTGSTITADNGLTKTGDNIQLGGLLLLDTTISGDNSSRALYLGGYDDADFLSEFVVGTNSYIALQNRNYTSAIEIDTQNTSNGVVNIYSNSSKSAGMINVGHNFGVQINAYDAYTGTNSPLNGTVRTRIQLTNTGATFFDFRTTKKGIEYGADYSSGYTNRSLVDREYVDNAVGGSSYTGQTVTGISFTAVTGSYFIGVSATTETDVWLPANPTPFKPYIVADIAGNGSTIFTIIEGNGKLIQGSSTALIDTDYGSITFIYNGFNWSIVAVV